MTSSGKEEVEISWSGYNTNLSMGFCESLRQSHFTDVTLIAEDKSIGAHRIILSTCSPYFDKTLKELGDYPKTAVILKDVQFSILCSILVYMYSGRVQVENDELPEFLKTAQSLQVKGLTESHDQPFAPERLPISCGLAALESISSKTQRLENGSKDGVAASVVLRAQKRSSPYPADINRVKRAKSSDSSTFEQHDDSGNASTTDEDTKLSDDQFNYESDLKEGENDNEETDFMGSCSKDELQNGNSDCLETSGEYEIQAQVIEEGGYQRLYLNGEKFGLKRRLINGNKVYTCCKSRVGGLKCKCRVHTKLVNGIEMIKNANVQHDEHSRK